MSDYDANPFADPNQQTNEPFSDPSVQQATGGGAIQSTGTLDNYNPFADGPGTTAPAAASTQPAVMAPSDAPPAYTQSAAQNIDTSELHKRQEDPLLGSGSKLRAREEELEKKAAELQRKEQEMLREQRSQGGNKKNNWPPLPACFPVGPCFFQDFSIDIPLEFQRIVKFTYYLWGFHVVVLFLNFLGSLAYFISKPSDGGTTFGLSILWFVLFSPCSFVCWYRPLYKAFRSDSSFNFFVFFFIFFFQFCVYVLQSLGVTGFTVGWINGLTVVGDSLVTGVIMLVIALCFTLLAVFNMIILIRVHRIYRGTGASFQKAQAEFATGVMKNDAVRGVAAQAASEAAHGVVTGYGGSDNRY